MKKTLLSAALIMGGLFQLAAQCTIVPNSCSPGTLGYCISPAIATPTDVATVGVPFSKTAQISVGSTVTVGPLTADITQGALKSITGLPPGLTYSTNPTDGVFLKNTSGCLIIKGTPTTAGVFTITLNFEISGAVGGFAQTLPQSATYTLAVSPSIPNGIKSINTNSDFVIAPNPASSELTINSSSHFGKVFVIDALGKTVISHDANYSSQTTINVSELSKGIYFIQANDGAHNIIKKFIKE